MTLNAALFSSADQTWNTPRWFVNRIESRFGRVGLDPCSNPASVVNAQREIRFDRGEDGLAITWKGHGLVYVNPPFGRVIGQWMDKCATDGDEVIALVPTRADAKWWHAAATACDALVLWRGRFSFTLRESRDHGNAPFASSVFYFGDRAHIFLREFSDDGFVAKQPSGQLAMRLARVS